MSCHHKIELIDSWLSYHWRNQVPCLSSPLLSWPPGCGWRQVGGTWVSAVSQSSPPARLLQTREIFPPDITRCEPGLQRCLSWASKKMDGSLPSPSLPPSILQLASDAAENFLADLVSRLSVGCLLFFFSVGLIFFSSVGWKESRWKFLNVNWLAVYHEPESCYLSRESLFVEPEPATRFIFVWFWFQCSGSLAPSQIRI